MAWNKPQLDHPTATIDRDVDRPNCVAGSQGATQRKAVNHHQFKRCADINNYPATAAFPEMAFKIYAVL